MSYCQAHEEHLQETQTKLESTNPFVGANMDSYCFQDSVANIHSTDPCFCMNNHQIYAPPLKLHKGLYPQMSAAQIMCMPVSLCPVESEEDYYPRERVPTLLPGQNDGTTPWEEFLHRFESCAKAN